MGEQLAKALKENGLVTETQLNINRIVLTIKEYDIKNFIKLLKKTCKTDPEFINNKKLIETALNCGNFLVAKQLILFGLKISLKDRV